MENTKTKKEIVEMLLKKKLDTMDEADLINMLIDEPIAIDEINKKMRLEHLVINLLIS